jgi:hypothetical protein
MMMHKLMQDEEDAVTDEDDKLLIMSAFLHLRAMINVPARRGGSRLGKKRKKYMQRMNVVVMLDSDYFANNAIRTPIEF